MINQELKKALLAKLGIQQQGLSKRAQAKKKQMPMSTEDATYLIAHEEGIRIDRFLTNEQVAHVRSLHTAGGRTPAPAGAPTRQRSRPTTLGPRELRFSSEFRISNPLLNTTKLAEARAMARVYPLLYVLENSMRTLIQRVMMAKVGANWWDTELPSGKLKSVHQHAQSRMVSEKKNSWHQKRGAHPIDYVELDDLETIINGKQQHFVPDIIPDLPWFQNFMKELAPSRHVVCHMNPLSDENVQDVKLKLQKWENMLRSAVSAIPS
jgi:hypothetical protein